LNTILVIDNWRSLFILWALFSLCVDDIRKDYCCRYCLATLPWRWKPISLENQKTPCSTKSTFRGMKTSGRRYSYKSICIWIQSYFVGASVDRAIRQTRIFLLLFCDPQEPLSSRSVALICWSPTKPWWRHCYHCVIALCSRFRRRWQHPLRRHMRIHQPIRPMHSRRIGAPSKWAFRKVMVNLP